MKSVWCALSRPHPLWTRRRRRHRRRFSLCYVPRFSNTRWGWSDGAAFTWEEEWLGWAHSRKKRSGAEREWVWKKGARKTHRKSERREKKTQQASFVPWTATTMTDISKGTLCVFFSIYLMSTVGDTSFRTKYTYISAAPPPCLNVVISLLALLLHSLFSPLYGIIRISYAFALPPNNATFSCIRSEKHTCDILDEQQNTHPSQRRGASVLEKTHNFFRRSRS